MSAADVVQLRENLGLTQVELAERLGVSHVAVHYWETGKRVPSGPASILLKQLQGQSEIAKQKTAKTA